jgi:chemosensory pili system protein ChpA (sensor histidine kinase/response regulator)
MMLEGTNASSAIRWVRQDLDEALQIVRDNLEAFAANKADRAPLKAVQEQLEQLNLTFLTMAQRGASLLTDEMIAVGGHMLHNSNANPEESLSALTDAVLVLPSYLDRLQAGHEDLPILLLPTLNELRATYDETLLSEGTLFAPQLDVMIPELGGNESSVLADSECVAFSRRMRNQYQMALLGWLKEQSKPDMLKPLQEVCSTLSTRLNRHSLRRMWWIAEMTIAGVREGAVDNDLPLRRLFARLDLTLKAMAEGGQSGPAEDAITALSRALLFHAAQAQTGSNPIDTLCKRFKLQELIPDREALLRARGAVTGRDASLFHSIGVAIREELNLVKDTLDMELRTGRVEKEQRESSVASLRQLSDTLTMLNLPVPARAVADLLPGLEQTDGTRNVELDSPLLKLARKLIEVESLLDAHIKLLGEPVKEEAQSGFIQLPASEQRLILSCLLDQCVVSLQEVQDSVRKMLGGDVDAGFDEQLVAISGALHLAGQAEVAELTDKLGRALHAGIKAKVSGASDEDARLIPLTDAVAALELYLTGCRDEQADSLRFLEIMHERLDGLPEASASGEALGQTRIHWPKRVVAEPETNVTPATADAVEPPVNTLDPDLQGVFLDEFDAVAKHLSMRLPAWLDDPGNTSILIEIKRGFHTLKGSGRMVGAMEIGDLAWRIEEVLNCVLEDRLAADATVSKTIRLAVACLYDLKARLLQQPSELNAAAIAGFSAFAQKLACGDGPSVDSLRALLPTDFVARNWDQAEITGEPADRRIEATAAGAIKAEEFESEIDRTHEDADHPRAQLMMAEIRQYISKLDGFMSATDSPPAGEVIKDLLSSVHSLAGTLSLSPLGQEVEVARALEHYFEALQHRGCGIAREAGPIVQICLHRFRQRLAILEHGNSTSYPLDDAQLLAKLAALSTRVTRAETIDAEAAAPAAEDHVLEVEAMAEGDDQAQRSADEPTPALLQIEDGGILSIFLEEATEILERCDTLLNQWRDKLADQKLVQNLQREIHTFKGGARMAGIDALGDLSHSMETLLERIAANRLQATVAAVQALEEGCDRLTLWVEELIAGRMPTPGDALSRFEQKAQALSVLPAGKPLTEDSIVAETSPLNQHKTEFVITPAGKMADPAVEAGEEPVVAAEDETSLSLPAPIPIETIFKQRLVAERPKREFYEVPDRPAVDSVEDGSSQPHIRVAAELMDSLVNFAGEISIYRARMEQQLGTVRFNLKEVGQTVGRLKEQLRKMDMETEAQMLSRYQNASSQGKTEFDPLELDRFSNMQQLSRAITESVSDLLNLQDMLDESVRQTESMLVQQSRVSSDLQEGLMQTRMTPFGSAAPRLRRVVRAAAAETGKKVRLQLKMAGSSDQLDRNVLERITAPLEHMLRNAVVHGIEAPKVRRKNDKPEEGEITVTVEAEATEFVVRVADDGNGVNLDAVRNRAIERGMINHAEHITDKRLLEFILESGFSTATTVTGLAGRGVGMDVVRNEIKQIGGSMEIASEAGKGTCFTIRIPFSLAVMQAIGITVGDRPFLVPLNSVGGVARMLPSDYLALRNSTSPVYEFAGEHYPVLELEPLLGEKPIPIDSGNVSLLMIRSGEHKAAFRVAELQGHQEVVIKPVGPQISSIPGILGATIGAEGQVVIILDMGPIIRRGLSAEPELHDLPVMPKQEKHTPLIMVVDDSITMRKVTSRVLENHSLEVMTAQDGLDAIEHLHERIPDLMLLDIEMPRMDGYELAEHMRADPRLRHIPIVMITSRAGQKHRKKAREAGANAYLTKPYQEAELIAQVGEMLKLELQQRRTD